MNERTAGSGGGGGPDARGPRTELRGRLILLFRLLKVDTVIGFDAYGRNEPNPDHYVTAQVADAACWMAGMGLDLPEQLFALQPGLVHAGTMDGVDELLQLDVGYVFVFHARILF